ncbi:MAG TPA: PepSY domain-containing protein [Lysobacter sp.]
MDPKTGEIYPDEQVANLNERDVRAQLSAAGYVNVLDVDYERGVWTTEGDDPSGRDVELKIDPATGKVIGKKKTDRHDRARTRPMKGLVWQSNAPAGADSAHWAARPRPGRAGGALGWLAGSAPSPYYRPALRPGLST